MSPISSHHIYTLNLYDVICQLHLNKAEKIQFNKMSPIQSWHEVGAQ